MAEENLFNLMEEMEAHERSTDESKEHRDTCIRSPFNYPGSKSRSVFQIIPHLPRRISYIEPFGGSGAVLLAQRPLADGIEVFNDRYAGVVAFYRCIRDKEKMYALCERLKLTVHSREDWVWCKETWQHNELDDVERAARWYYMLRYSFAGLCRNFGRATKTPVKFSGKLLKNIPELPNIYERLKNVQIENLDWEDCIRDYDQPGAVFYIDPPYVDADPGIYRHLRMTREDHQRLLNTIMNMQGFAAVSGYTNPLYENQDWSNRFEWESFVSIQSIGGGHEGHKAKHHDIESRAKAKEVLWIKEANG